MGTHSQYSTAATMSSASKPDIKLVYFNLRGRAEPSRLLLAYAGLSYVDERIPYPEDPEGWAARKSSMPFGVLPVLYWNGEEISQGIAVSGFLAKKVGLAGRNDMEAAQIDKKRQQTMKNTFENQTVPTLLKQLERRLETRGGQFFVGNNLTWADIQTFMLANEVDQEALKVCPKVANLVKRVGEIPNIKKWVQARPETIV